MTTLIVSPDYLSHYNPLSTMGRALQACGERVIVATGTAVRERVAADGFGWTSLRLGPSSNPGVVADDPAVRRFLAATKLGPSATIRHQALEREHDLLWQPVRTGREILRLLDRLDPTHVIVDHVSFGSTLALHASGRPFTTLVPGHPTQLPVGLERFGVPPEWPPGMEPPAEELAAIHTVADRVAAAFTERWNEALLALDPGLRPVEDAVRVHGDRVLYNSVALLQSPGREELLPDNRFVGPLVRSATGGRPCCSWGPTTSDRAHVYVALGTFLSRRGDVLARLADGLRRLEVRAAIATGPTPPDELGPIPSDWIVAPVLPQVALLAGADVAIHHGGNNSVQEALAAGSRQIVLPFSTDQFATAADLHRRAGAAVLPPNEITGPTVADAIMAALGTAAPEPVEPSPDEVLAAAVVG